MCRQSVGGRGKKQESILREAGKEARRREPCPGGSHPGLCSHYSAQVVLVGQEPVLFSGSVRDNITYGLESCSDEKVMAAVQAARADEFITEMEHGLYTGTFSQKRSWSLFVGSGLCPSKSVFAVPLPFPAPTYPPSPAPRVVRRQAQPVSTPAPSLRGPSDLLPGASGNTSCVPFCGGGVNVVTCV